MATAKVSVHPTFFHNFPSVVRSPESSPPSELVAMARLPSDCRGYLVVIFAPTVGLSPDSQAPTHLSRNPATVKRSFTGPSMHCLSCLAMQLFNATPRLVSECSKGKAFPQNTVFSVWPPPRHRPRESRNKSRLLAASLESHAQEGPDMLGKGPDEGAEFEDMVEKIRNLLLMILELLCTVAAFGDSCLRAGASYRKIMPQHKADSLKAQMGPGPLGSGDPLIPPKDAQLQGPNQEQGRPPCKAG